jgi:glycosyltransferase involved in cell wall biosynthesis
MLKLSIINNRSQQMRIVFLTRRFYPLIGGVEKHVLEISKCLVALGHEVIVISEELKSPNEQNYHSKIMSAKTVDVLNKIKIHRIAVGGDDWFKKFRIWLSLWKLRHTLLSADIIHCHDVFFWYLPFRLLYPTKRVYTTFHGYEMVYPIPKRYIVARKFFEALSAGTIQVGDLRKWYHTHPNKIIYGAVNNIKNAVDKQQPIKRRNEVSIIFLGRLDTDNGIAIYLQALKLLQQQKCNFSFAAFGEGVFRSSIRQMGTVHGFVENVPAAINSADIVFASSYLSILESLALRKYVIAAYVDEFKRDVLTNTPFGKWICVSNSPTAIAQHIHRFVTQKNHFLSSRLAAQRWVRTQTWEKLTQTYLALWRT